MVHDFMNLAHHGHVGAGSQVAPHGLAKSSKFRNAVTLRMGRQGGIILCFSTAKSACPHRTNTITMVMTAMY
jgi:hypothetical protein